MKRIIYEAPRKLLKVRLIYQGNDTWQLKPVSTKSGQPIVYKDYIMRGDDEKVRKHLMKLQAKDTETDPATVRNDSYKHMVQVAKETGRNTVWVWSNLWQSSNKVEDRNHV